ncbi:MAG: glutamine--fructose-6-phosphate transaminase (isomerizing) [Campylobacterales bacterium]|nr:glutamine--fructose-6-phosphate transaminase (isomerizing) [Campylobacterales bacterium]
MCGIVGFIGDKEKKQILIDGLRELEYRGYDSAGIAVMDCCNISVFKAVGKIVNLEHKMKDVEFNGFGVGIGHTRWATHGKPTELNAHPHLGEFSYVVHNGIIENYQELKTFLISKGRVFLSQTDTEVIVHLFEYNLSLVEDCFNAFEKTINELKGAFAILLMTKKESDKIFFAKQGSPLIVGKSNLNEIYFSSSDAPLIGHVDDVIYLEDGEYGFAKLSEISIFKNFIKIDVAPKKLPNNKQFAQKSGFRFFMEKEIYEQSQVIADTMIGRVKDSLVHFEELENIDISKFNSIKICACGTSYHSALVGSYLFERVSKIQTSVEIASEFRYKEPLLHENTLFIVISQSGETADTLEALKMAKHANMITVAICNVDNSSMVRVADFSILTRAGIEKGVASTKAFTTQVMVLWMMALHFAQIKKVVNSEFIEKEILAMRESSNIIKVKEFYHEKVKRLSKRYLHGHGFFFIGRDVFYPLALEGALKLKEISYLHAEGYPAGEMKHGPIALADSELFTVALMPKNILHDKIKSNVEELSARDATILSISPIEFNLSDDFIKTTDTEHFMLEFFEMSMILQLFAMEISIRLGNDVDMPRNLAKSVTVE